MITLQRDKQLMKYANQGREIEILQPYVDDDGNTYQLPTGNKKIVYFVPVEFSASISNKLNEVLVKDFGIDDSTRYAQIVTAKGSLPIKAGSLIWKQSAVMYEDEERLIPNETSADYTVMGVADEGLNYDLFLLKRNVR